MILTLELLSYKENLFTFIILHLELIMMFSFIISIINRHIIFIIKIIAVLIIFILWCSILCLFFSLLSLYLILVILHLLFSILGGSPCLFTNFLSLLNVISYQKVVKDGARLDLPQIETNFTEFIILAKILGIISIVLRIINLRMDPGTFVGRIVNLSWLPFSLIFRVINHSRLPLTIPQDYQSQDGPR